MNIEKEVQRLMDIEAIKDLKNRYARMCNDNHNYELVDTIFSPDVRWEGSPDDPWGSAVGREAFIELFKGFQKQMDGRCLGHNITNPIPMATGTCSEPSKVVRRARGPASASWSRATMTTTM